LPAAPILVVLPGALLVLAVGPHYRFPDLGLLSL